MDLMSGTAGGVKKLMIIPLEKNPTVEDPSINLVTSEALTCQFNPERMYLGKNNFFRYRNDMGSDVPEVVFSGGLSHTLQIDLLFDSTDKFSLLTGATDVRELYEPLLKMTRVRDNTDEYSEPPYVVVQWGKFISFICVIDSVTEEFELFADNGVPLRANVRVCFKQAHNEAVKGGTNPTSRSEARRTWVVEKGQRLDWIAYEAYGQASAWRHIAETNDILDPTQLVPGQILKLTPLA